MIHFSRKHFTRMSTHLKSKTKRESKPCKNKYSSVYSKTRSGVLCSVTAKQCLEERPSEPPTLAVRLVCHSCHLSRACHGPRGESPNPNRPSLSSLLVPLSDECVTARQCSKSVPPNPPTLPIRLVSTRAISLVRVTGPTASHPNIRPSLSTLLVPLSVAPRLAWHRHLKATFELIISPSHELAGRIVL